MAPRSPPPLMPLLRFVPPMAAQTATELPEGPDWAYEVKFDGYRALDQVR